MAYAGHIDDLPPITRYSSNRIKPLINQTIQENWVKEVMLALLWRIEQLEEKVADLEVKHSE